MDIRNFESILTVGENVAVEFKRCGSGIGNDVYESICSFLNRLAGICLWEWRMMVQLWGCRRKRHLT